MGIPAGAIDTLGQQLDAQALEEAHAHCDTYETTDRHYRQRSVSR